MKAMTSVCAVEIVNWKKPTARDVSMGTARPCVRWKAEWDSAKAETRSDTAVARPAWANASTTPLIRIWARWANAAVVIIVADICN